MVGAKDQEVAESETGLATISTMAKRIQRRRKKVRKYVVYLDDYFRGDIPFQPSDTVNIPVARSLAF
jgi:hypothetical protein